MTEGTAEVVHADARNLAFLEDETVDLIVTSPPYFALRSYRDEGEHYDGQIGSEDTPEQFLDALMECMTEWRRVLKPSGSVWINLGDKYAGSGGHNNADIGSDPERGPSAYVKASGHARPKSLMGLPWRFAIRCIDDGWILRAEVIWSKPNGLPESVTDRVRRSHEQWFHFTKEPRYFSAVDEVREEQKTWDRQGETWPNKNRKGGGEGNLHRSDGVKTTSWAAMDKGATTLEYNPLGRLPGSVWTVPTEPLIIPDEIRQTRNLPDHFAAFPQEWPRRIILGWSPTGICQVCGEGMRPVVEKELVNVWHDKPPQETRYEGHDDEHLNNRKKPGALMETFGSTSATITSYACSCETPGPLTPAVVLDPFGGTGTVAGVARALGRHGISVDLSHDYNRLAAWRIFESGHFDKTLKRTMEDRQGSLL